MPKQLFIPHRFIRDDPVTRECNSCCSYYGIIGNVITSLIRRYTCMCLILLYVILIMFVSNVVVMMYENIISYVQSV